MAPNLADRLAAVFAGGNFEAAIFAALAVLLLVGVLAVLWYGYASKYVYEERTLGSRNDR